MDESGYQNLPGNLWRDTLLRGIIAVIFGLMLFLWPGLSIAVFIMLFGAFALADGILLILQSITTKRHEGNWWIRALQGLVSIAAGIAVFVWPGITALAFLYLIAFYLLIEGLLQIFAAVELRKVIKGEVLLILGGILSLIVGVLLIVRPIAGAIALAQTIGIFAVAYGIILTVLAFKIRGYTHRKPMAKGSA